MATDIYCGLDCTKRLKSGLCKQEVVVLEIAFADGTITCQDFRQRRQKKCKKPSIP